MASSKHHLELLPSIHLNAYLERPFSFSTQLHTHPLLQLNAIRDLALRLPPDTVFFSSGKLAIGDDFDNAHRTRRTGLSLAETLADLESAASYLFIRRPDADPAYAALFGEILAEVSEFKRTRDPGIADAMLYLFVASPGSQTPFHADRYQTFLTQIAGSKVVSVWDQHCERSVSPAEMDALFAFDKAGEPRYKPGIEERSTDFELRPGDGLYIPLGAPHSVVSGPEVSVGLSIIYRTRESKRRAAAHRFNHWLRRRGRRPRKVGENPLLDTTKQVLSAVQGAVSRVRGRSS